MLAFQTFISQHWILSSSLMVAILGLAYIELILSKQSSSAVDVKTMVQLMNQQHAVVIDIRTEAQFAKGHIVGSISLPKEEFSARLPALRKKIKKQPVIVICTLGRSAIKIHQALLSAGLNSCYLLDGLKAWQQEGMPLVQLNQGSSND